MEFLLSVLTRRNAMTVAAAAAALFAANHFQEYPRRWYREWRYPAQNGAPPGGAEILLLRQRQQSAALRRRFERVSALLAQAETDGFDISGLRRKAVLAMSFNGANQYRYAEKLLNETEMSIPRKKVQYIPLYPNEEEDVEILPDVPGRKAREANKHP
jgi:hypothetical protein